MFKNLFKLRGSISTQSALVLSVLGFVLVLLLWIVVAEFLSKDIIKIADISETALKDKTYFEQDSLLVAHYDRLEKMDDAQLANYGLTKQKVYPLLPSPLNVVKAIPELVNNDNLVSNAFYSIKLNLLGYLIAICIAIPLGFLLGLIPLFRGLFSKLIDSVRFIPLTAVTGIFIMWFGLGSEMKVLFLAFGILVYLIPVVVQRIYEVENVHLNTVFTLGANSWQTIKTVYFPYVMSKLIDDIRVLTAISWTYITIAEMLNKGGGIGELIWMAKRQSRIDKAFALLIIIVIIGIVQDRIFYFLDKFLFPYKQTNQTDKA